MRNAFKILSIPCGLALASALPAYAAPANSGHVPAEADQSRAAPEATPIHHTWRHTREQEERRAWRRYHRYHYGPPAYGPRCYWSRYYQQHICR